MAIKKIADLVATTSANDTDILIIEDASATKKITFISIFNKIKSKLNLATIATSGKLADATGDESNRTIKDTERRKWDGYENTLDELNRNYEYAPGDGTYLARIGGVKQFCYSTSLTNRWVADSKFLALTLPSDYRPRRKITTSVVLRKGVTATIDVEVDGKMYITPHADVAVGGWVMMQFTYI